MNIHDLMKNNAFRLFIIITLGIGSIHCSSGKNDQTAAGNNDSPGTRDSAISPVLPADEQEQLKMADWNTALKALEKKVPDTTVADTSKKKYDMFKYSDEKEKSKLKLVSKTSPELQSGLEKAKNGDLKGAIVDFTAALKADPKLASAYFYRAKALIELGNQKEALPDLDSALRYRPNQSLFYYYRGKIYSDQGNYERAIAEFNQALNFLPGFPDALNYRGVTKARQGKHEEAIIDYEAAVEKNPDFALAFYNKGTSEAALGEYKKASESFSKSIKLDPEYRLSYLNRGNCYVMLEEYQAAIDDFTRLIEMEPKNADAYYNRGSAYYLKGDAKMCDDWKKAASMGNAKAKEAVSKYCR